MKLRFWIVIGLWVLMSLSPTLAQDDLWSVYLFSTETNGFMRVYENGVTEVVDLGLSADGSEYINSDVSISPDGRLAIFCVQHETAQPLTTLRFYDLESATTLLDMDYGDVAWCQLGGFNADGSQMAIVLTHQVETSGLRSLDPTRQYQWRVALVDTTTGAIVDELSSQSPNAPVATNNGEAWLLVIFPEAIEPNRLVFRALPAFVTEPQNLMGYVWEFETDTVTMMPEVGLFGADYAPQTGEILYPGLDESRAYIPTIGYFNANNVINLQSSVDTPPQEVYYNGEWIFAGARFINNGEQFLIYLIPPPDIRDSVIGQEHFVLVGRDGSSMEFSVTGFVSNFSQSVADSPDGAVMVWLDPLDSGTNRTYVALLQADGTMRVFAQVESNDEFPIYWRVVGVVSS